jgi:hypothetical protein
MTSDKEFQAKLAIGTEGEDKVYEWLKRNNSLVEDSRYQNHDKGHGPRLEGREGIVVLPDFVVYNKYPEKGNFAVDVKVKTSTYPVKGKQCFTVDKKYEDYKRSVEIKKLDFLAIIIIYEGDLYFYKDSDCCGTTVYNNQHSKGTVYLFELDESKKRLW